MKRVMSVATACQRLTELRREHRRFQKSRIKLHNETRSSLAHCLGYEVGIEEAERKLAMDAADAFIDKVRKAAPDATLPPNEERLRAFTQTQIASIDSFLLMEETVESHMVEHTAFLPKQVREWVDHADQTGFGVRSLATIIGETGDLSGYPNPGKVWRRMGCAPYTKDDETLMGRTWAMRIGNKDPRVAKLSSDEWEEFGYNKRRRSVMYNIGKNLLMLNGRVDGPYRRRYDQAKLASAANPAHSDWCKNHHHFHAMLLLSKLLLKNLWIVWNPDIAKVDV